MYAPGFMPSAIALIVVSHTCRLFLVNICIINSVYIVISKEVIINKLSAFIVFKSQCFKSPYPQSSSPVAAQRQSCCFLTIST